VIRKVSDLFDFLVEEAVPPVKEMPVLSVSELNLRVKSLLEAHFFYSAVRGEISNVVRASSGYYYFKLKDSNAQIDCVLFKLGPSCTLLPQEGLEVVIHGRVSLYEKAGRYQLIVDKLTSIGRGELYHNYLLLKDKLTKLGYFSNEHKKKIPFFPQRVGIVTSASGAVAHDIITTLKRRMSSIEIVIYPTAVQGLGSERQIARAIAEANRRQEVDVLIVARGGGSLEDLWSFNEEVVVKAIYDSQLPVVCAVGHETDFSLADFAADLRAPTPTAAAELVSPAWQEQETKRQILSKRLYGLLLACYAATVQQLDSYERIFGSSTNLLLPHQHRLLTIRHQLKDALQEKERQAEQNVYKQKEFWRDHLRLFNNFIFQLHEIQRQLKEGVEWRYQQKNQDLQHLIQLLNALSPQKILYRGYSIALNSQGKAVSSSKQIHSGEILQLKFASGSATVKVNNKQNP
jgi:exodeoxyribonuclease VII, large subunit